VKERELELIRDLVKSAADIQEASHVTAWWHIGGDSARPFMTEPYRALDGIYDCERPSFQDASEYPPEYTLRLLKSAMLQEHLKLHPDLSEMMGKLTHISQAQSPIGKLGGLPAVRALLLILGALEQSQWPPRDYSNLLVGFAKAYSKR
jgi:hypothetical protein